MNSQDWARNRLEAAVVNGNSSSENASAVIWAAVAINAGLGAVPFGINIWTFIAVSAVMVTIVGTLYGYHYSHEQAGRLLRQILVSAGASWTMTTFGLKFFAEVMKGVGVITMGGVTVGGMVLDALLAGAVTYALGFTAKAYFQHDTHMTQAMMQQSFRKHYAEGKSKIRDRS